MNTLEAQFLAQLSQGSLVVIALAFLGGVVSSLLPCSVGMLPILVGYVGGYSQNNKWVIFSQVILFVTGVSLTLTFLGLSVSLLGVTFGTLHQPSFYIGAGVVAILMGLHLLEIIQLPLPQLVTRLPQTETGQWLTPLLLGMAFGLASSPCGTPFLTGILGLMSTQKNIPLGALALFAYGMGQGMLLLMAGLFTGVLKHMATLRQVGQVINTLSGWLFVAAGLVLIAQGAGWLDVFAFY